MGEQSIASAIDSLFKDAYTSLEQVQEHADDIESFSDSILNCHWAISNLERIHRIYSQNPYSTLAQDAFSLRSNLEKSIGSCHTLIRLVGLLSVSSDVGCWIGGGKTALKKKHVRELQEEFWDHQRILSLVLANAVYMTTLDMQRDSATPDPELDFILRQSQRRHTVYERTEKPGHEHKSQKPVETHVEQLEFSVCLRKYFEYIERQATGAADVQPTLSQQIPLPPSTAMVRYSITSSQSSEQQWHGINRRKSLTYGNSMETNSYNEIYTRPRRNSTISRPSSVGPSSRNNSIGSMQSFQMAANSSALPSPMISAAQIRDRSVGTTNRQSSPAVQSLSVEETISRAWADIVQAMQTMSILEARAYVEGRLAGVDPDIMVAIRQAIHGTNLLPPVISSPVSNMSTPDLSSATSLWDISDSARPAPRTTRPRSQGPTPVLAAAQSMPSIRMVPSLGPMRAASDPALQNKAKRQSHPRPDAEKRVSRPRSEHARQLSTIVERPWTAKSRGESLRSRRSIFNLKKDKPLPQPKSRPDPPSIERKPSDGSQFSSDGSTLRGSTPEETRVFDLEEVPEEPGPLPEIKKKRRHKHTSNTSKPLPMTPGQLLEPGLNGTPAPSVRSRLLRLVSPRSMRSMNSLSSSMSTPTLSSAQAGMRSRETVGQLSNASLECLRKGGMNGSRSTLLVAYQEGPDQPFQVWLNASPYIEGRTDMKI